MKLAAAEVLGPIHALWTVGAVGGLDDAALLARYADRRDGPAFEAIVSRHGPMVRAACRSLAADPHEADDLFQATFLVLARRAGSIRRPGALGPWLHGVARRVAAEARARRRAVGRDLVGIEPVAATIWPDLDAPIVHEEIGRLPRKYRDPIILCYLEGLTHDEAAARLGCPVGTVRGRLARARDMLRPRLTKRGLATASILLAAAPSARATAVPRFLLDATTRSALLSAESATTGAMALSQGVLHAMLWTKLKLVAAGLVGATLAAGGAGALIVRPEPPQDGPAAPSAPEAPAPAPAQIRAPAPPPADAPAPPRPPTVVEAPPTAIAPPSGRRRPGPTPPRQVAPPAAARRSVPAGKATGEVVAEINEFRARQLAEVTQTIQAVAGEIREVEEEIRRAEEEIGKVRGELDDKREALRMLESLRDDLQGRRRAPGAEELAEPIAELDAEIAPAARRPARREFAPEPHFRRAEPTPTPQPMPEPRIDEPPRATAPAPDADRLTALERRLDGLFELIEGKNPPRPLRP